MIVKMGNQTQEVKSFFFGQYFANGLKITLGIVLPALILSAYDALEVGIILSLGALYVGITDHPGPLKHKRNGMFFANAFIFIIGLITGSTSHYTWLMIFEIPLFFFAFGMLTNYGARASAVGTAALLMMISCLHLESVSIDFVTYALLSLAGGVWYMLLSLSLSQIRPYRQAQQVLGECIIEVGKYLRMKADFYENETPVEEVYNKLVAQQVTVSTQQDNVRQILFITRKKVRETMKSGRLLIMIFIDIIDLFEQTMSTHHDYTIIRQRYLEHGVLSLFRNMIHKLAFSLDNLGHALINNEKPRPPESFKGDLIRLKEKLDDLERNGISVLVLKKILINVRNIVRLLEHTYSFFRTDRLPFLSKTEEADLTKFVSRQSFDWRIFKNNLSLRSGVFRHSLRLSIAGLLGYLISLLLPYGQHSYWILVSVLVILKPDFSLTKKRNYGRVVGTIAGGLIGAFILLVIKDEAVRLVLLIVFMVLAFSFNRTRYVISVLFITALVLILFSFLYQTSNLDVTMERVLYTFVGSAIAFCASYFIFPSWESFQIKTYLSAIVKANLTYFEKIISRFGNHPVDTTAFKLARKDVYVQTANLGAAFQRMLNEPKSKQENTAYLNEFIVLNHMMSSYLASFSSVLEETQTPLLLSEEHIRLIRKTKSLLLESIKVIDQKPFAIDFEIPRLPSERSAQNYDVLFIQEQLNSIKKAATGIERLSKTLYQH